MKKLLSALLVLLLVLASAPALAQESFDPTGTWYFNAFELPDRKLGAGYAGIEGTLQFEADHTARILWNGEPTDCLWAWDGNTLKVTHRDMDIVMFAFTVQDGALVADMGLPLLFERESIPYSDFETGQPCTGASLADFNGTWQAVILDTGYTLTPLDMLSLVMRLEIHDGSIRFTSSFGDGEDIIEGKAVIESGVMILDTTSAESGSAQAYLRLFITDRDVLIFQMSNALDGFTYYAQRVVP